MINSNMHVATAVKNHYPVCQAVKIRPFGDIEDYVSSRVIRKYA